MRSRIRDGEGGEDEVDLSSAFHPSLYPRLISAFFCV